MTTFLDMKNLLRDEINKGSIHDSLLGPAIEDAVLWFERNNELRSMERLIQTDPLEVVTSYPNPIPLPPNIKLIKGIRVAYPEDGEVRFQRLEKVEQPDSFRRNSYRVGVGNPQSYWTEGYKFLWLDAFPAETFILEFFIHQYSGKFEDADEPWIFQFGRQPVKAQAMIFMIPTMRAPELLQLYQPIVDKELPVMLKADEEYLWSGTDNRMTPADDDHWSYVHG